jgi:hypothetical protein
MIKPRAVAVLAVMVLVAGLALSAGPARAAAAAAEPPVTVARFGRTALAKATQPASQRARADRGAEARVNRYLDEQARSGRLVDRKALKMALLPSPFAKGEVGVIWDDAAVLDKLDLFQQANDEQGQVGIGAVFGESPSSAAKDAVAAGGFGYGGGFNPKGMYKYSSGCRTVFFAAPTPPARTTGPPPATRSGPSPAPATGSTTGGRCGTRPSRRTPGTGTGRPTSPSGPARGRAMRAG